MQSIIHENATERISVFYNMGSLRSILVCILNQASPLFSFDVSGGFIKQMRKKCYKSFFYNAVFVQIQYSENLTFFNI